MRSHHHAHQPLPTKRHQHTRTHLHRQALQLIRKSLVQRHRQSHIAINTHRSSLSSRVSPGICQSLPPGFVILSNAKDLLLAPTCTTPGGPFLTARSPSVGFPKKQTALLHGWQPGRPYRAQGLFRAMILVESSAFHFLHRRFEVFYKLRHSHRQVRRTHAQGPCRLGQ